MAYKTGRKGGETYPESPRASSSGGGGAIVRLGFDNSTDGFRYDVIGDFAPVLRTGTTPLGVPLTGFKRGNLILIEFSVTVQDGVASGPSGASADFVPTVDLGAGPRKVHLPEVGSLTLVTGGNLPATAWILGVIPESDEVTADPVVGLLINSRGPDTSSIVAYGASLIAYEMDSTFVTQVPTYFLDP